MKKTTLSIAVLLSTALYIHIAQGFCGFYVAKADAKLFNQASQVVLTRFDDKTVMTMANDFKGDLTEFAVVIPVPTFINQDQIHIGDKKIIDHLDAYTAPRLVEYFDRNPCYQIRYKSASTAASTKAEAFSPKSRDRSLGVTVEAEYTVGEYDIVILSATQTDKIS